LRSPGARVESQQKGHAAPNDGASVLAQTTGEVIEGHQATHGEPDHTPK
jgi:hypothetical protein